MLPLACLRTRYPVPGAGVGRRWRPETHQGYFECPVIFAKALAPRPAGKRDRLSNLDARSIEARNPMR